jgi:hypothetical protein
MCLGYLIRTVSVNTLHMVKQIVRSRESTVRAWSFTVLELAEERFVSMSMESVGFTFVAEKAGGGGETVVVAVLMLAAEWLDVRINVLAVTSC